MGRSPCCDKAKVRKGPWSNEEDALLINFVANYGNGGNWISLPKRAGLNRCGKSCRLRWLNYLRPDIKHGDFTDEEDYIIYILYSTIGSRWSIIASKLPGRTDNDVKNYWNTRLKKKISSGKFENVNNNINHDTIISSYIHMNSELDIPKDHREFMLHDQIVHNDNLIIRDQSDEKQRNKKCYTTSSGSSSLTEEISSCSRSSSSSSSSSMDINQSNNFGSMGFSREDDEFWMDLLSDSFDDGFVVGSMLDDKIHEIASLLDDSFTY